jgi:hypothetical protein
MTERQRPASGPHEPAAFDQEIDTRSVLSFGIGLALTMIVVLTIVWVLLAFWRERRIAQDPAPSPMAEANAPRVPPGPNLQASPVRDMEALRARENAILGTYGWVDRQAGIGRIPIDRAVDLLLENGLPASAPAQTPQKVEPRSRRPGRRTASPAPRGVRP